MALGAKALKGAFFCFWELSCFFAVLVPKKFQGKMFHVELF